MLNFNYLPFLILLGFQEFSGVCAEEVAVNDAYNPPRIERLLKIARLNTDAQRPARYMRILERQGENCDIGAELTLNTVEIVRIWSLGESADRVRTIFLRKDGSAEMIVKFYPSQPERKYEMNTDEVKEFSRMIRSPLSEPLVFKKSGVSTGSNSVDYIMEAVSLDHYGWAVREADFSPVGDYQAMGRIIDWIREREK